MAVTPSQRMGPSPAAAPPMRIAASWSRPVRGLPNTSVLGRKPKGRAPLGRPIGSSSSIAAGNKPTARGLTTIAPYKPAPAKAGVSVATSATKPRDGQFMLHAKCCTAFDGHTLRPVVAGVETRSIHVDKGYRGHNHAQKFRVWISGQVRRVTDR